MGIPLWRFCESHVFYILKLVEIIGDFPLKKNRFLGGKNHPKLFSQSPTHMGISRGTEKGLISFTLIFPLFTLDSVTLQQLVSLIYTRFLHNILASLAYINIIYFISLTYIIIAYIIFGQLVKCGHSLTLIHSFTDSDTLVSNDEVQMLDTSISFTYISFIHINPSLTIWRNSEVEEIIREEK